jgi:hypothetical protein
MFERRWTARLAALVVGPSAVCPAAGPPARYTALAWIAPARPLMHVVGAVRYQSNSDPDRVTADLDSRPPGARALLRWESNDNHVWHNPLDQLQDPRVPATRPATGTSFQGPWIPNGAAAEAAFEDRFAAALQQRRATPDFLVLDTEMGVGTWSLTPPQLAAIVADPRWPPLARRFNVRSTAALIGVLDSPDARAFNLAMQVTEGGYFRAAYFEPWLRHFPDLHGSDFGDGVLDERSAAQAPDDGGVVEPMGLPMHGDTQSPCCYAWVHHIGRPPASQGADFTKPLPVLCWQASAVRAYARSPRPIVPWIAAKSWTDGSPRDPAGSVGIRNTPFQDELVWQVCLSGGCVNVLFFNPDGRPADDAAMDADLAALQQQTGDAPSFRPLTTDPVPYGAAVLASGAITPTGRRVYRVTVGSAAAVARQVDVTLPGERDATSVAIPAGACGAWVLK